MTDKMRTLGAFSRWCRALFEKWSWYLQGALGTPQAFLATALLFI